MKPYAEFAYIQDMGDGIKLRYYHVRGDHALEGSTVSIKTLVENGIDITDIPLKEIVAEFLKAKDFIEKQDQREDI